MNVFLSTLVFCFVCNKYTPSVANVLRTCVQLELLGSERFYTVITPRQHVSRHAFCGCLFQILTYWIKQNTKRSVWIKTKTQDQMCTNVSKSYWTSTHRWSIDTVIVWKHVECQL